MVGSENKNVIARIDIDPTEEILVQLMVENSIDRNDDLKAFLSMLDSIQGGYSFVIDGKWGDGKTFFIKQAILLLEYLNTRLEGKGESAKPLFGNSRPFVELSKDGLFLPVYYNAWQNDIYGDPLFTLVDTLAEASYGNTYRSEKFDNAKKQQIVELMDTGLNIFGFDLLAKEVKNIFDGENALDSLNKIKAVNDRLEKLITELLKDKADKIILFIDELDRCNPVFAMKLLERIKFLFSRDNIILVFSTNIEQLSRTVEAFYGIGFDGERYLSRFYDRKLSLNSVPNKKYLERLGIFSGHRFDKAICEMTTMLNFAMRDCNRYSNEAIYIREKLNRRSPVTMDQYCFQLVIIPVILAIRIFDTDKYRKIISGGGFDLLLPYVRGSSYLSKQVEEYVKKGTKEGKTLEQYLEEVYTAAFGSDRKLEAWDYDLFELAQLFLSLEPYSRY